MSLGKAIKSKKDKIFQSMQSELSVVKVILKGFFKISSKPWEILLNIFIPKSHDGYYVFVQFFIPLFFIWNVSEIELFLLEKLIGRLNISPSFLGLTIMAWGNNAPDMFNVASAMSKGMIDLALNAAIASEIHNVLLGLGLPWLVYNCSLGKPITFNSSDLYAFTLFFFCIFIITFIVALKINENRLDWKLATYLIITYLVYLVIIFLISFKNIL